MTKKEKQIYEAKAKILKAIAHPTRLWIVDKLSHSTCCVCEFVDEIEADFSTISKHLSVLKEAGIIVDEKKGKNVFYTLKTPCILRSLDCATKVLKDQLKERQELIE